MRGRIIDAVPIGQRPAEVEGRLVPGHHEGDLVMGSAASNSAVGTIVERTTGYLTLLPLPGGHDAASVADAIIEHMSALPPWFARTLTWDRGKELARHQRITAATGIGVYFADPYSPWQRGSNETPTACSANTSPKAPAYPPGPPHSSTPSPPNSTTGPASASATTPPAKPSINSSPRTYTALRRPPESAGGNRP
jgi:hypothetical protein